MNCWSGISRKSVSFSDWTDTHEVESELCWGLIMNIAEVIFQDNGYT